MNRNPISDRACARALLCTLVLGALIQYFSEFGRRELPGGLDSPVLATELLESSADVVKVVGEKGTTVDWEVMIRVVQLDFVFVVSYTASLVFIGIFAFQQVGRLRYLGIAAILLTIGAAACDFLENLRILSLLQESGSGAAVPRNFALWKWGFLFLAVGFEAPVYLHTVKSLARRSLGHAALTFSIIAAALGLWGSVPGILQIPGYDSLIEYGARFLSLGLIFGFGFFATQGFLANGLLPALNHLATKTPFKALRDWPSDEDS